MADTTVTPECWPPEGVILDDKSIHSVLVTVAGPGPDLVLASEL